MSNNTLLKSLAAILFVTVLAPLCASAADIWVYPGDNLNTRIANAKGGDTVYIYNGTFGPINLANRHFTESAPLRIRGIGGPNTIIESTTWDKEPLLMTNCRYVVFEYMTFKGGTRAAWVKNCRNIIMKTCYFTGSDQEGLHIESSHYVDVRGGKVYNTGRVPTLNPGNPTVNQWAEGIYVGSGTAADICSRIWIESVEIHNTGRAEAVDFKPGVRESTIRGCQIYNISNGRPDVGQVNEGAISINGYDYSTFKLTAPQNNWVENNHIRDISGGNPGKNRGIMVFAGGVTVKDNQVHHCANEGIRVSNWGPGQKFTTRVYNNWLYNNNGGNLIIDPNITVLTTNPGNNPFSRQAWYP